MIFRKPYAFLIKHFRLIHVILTAILCYIIYKTNNILSFFNEYLDLRTYERIDNLANTYIPNYLYLVIIGAMLISVIIFLLMREKDKPLKFYIILIIYYIALSVGLLWTTNQLQNISFKKIDVLQLRITRDLLYVLVYGQLPFVIMSLIRATGFNIKKFNFQRDLMELNIDSKDNEEVELDIAIDSNDVKTKLRHRKRIILYVFKENKFLILLALGVILIISGIISYNIMYVKNKIYQENEIFTYKGININILDSYQLNHDSFGNDLSTNKYSYTIIRVKVKNTTNNTSSFKVDKFRLRINNKTAYDPNYQLTSEFNAYGKVIKEVQLNAKEEQIFIIVYRIDQEYENYRKQLDFINAYKEVKGVRTYKLTKISLNPKYEQDATKMGEVSLGESLNFKDSLLKNTTITLNDFKLDDRFIYRYQKCLDVCYDLTDYIAPKNYLSQNMMVMRLKVDIDVDPNIYNNDIRNSLVTSVGHIRYKIGDHEYQQEVPIQDITPSNINDYTYFEVKGELKKADEIYMDFIIYDKLYTYILKAN